jgi:dUTP pyrophosphatase
VSGTRLPFLLGHADARLPAAAHPGDAGLDLRSVEDAVIAPGERRLVQTGLRVALPAGHAGLVLPRSGLALHHGISVLNAPGLVDAPYRGPIGVILLNTDREQPFAIAVGDRIAQLVVVRVADVEPVAAAELDESVRGEGGFGSSGRA